MPEHVSHVKLKVLEALQDDAYKGVARIDTEVMRALGLTRGDIISISGERETLAIVDRSYPADIGEGIIRIDGLTRKNAKTSIGEKATIKKAIIKPAKKLAIAPAQKGIMVQGDPELFKNSLLGRALVKGDIISLGGAQRRRDLMHDMDDVFGEDFGSLIDSIGKGFGFSGFQNVKFLVVSTSPNQPVIITEDTEVVLNTKAVTTTEDVVPDVTYEDIGGLKEEIKKIREMVELPLKHPEIFDRLGIEPPKGVILHGPPGTGKTLLAKAVANESEANFILLNGPEVMCVSGDTPLLTNPKGYIKAEDIFKEKGKVEKFRNYNLKKLDSPISTFSFKDGKVKKAHITHVTKLNANSFKVQLSDGNEIVTSENQPFLVYRNGELVWEAIKNIKPGDFVARLNKVNLKEKSYKIPVEKLNKKLDLIEKNGKVTIKNKNLPRSNFIKLPKKTSPELLELLGLIVSDGNISGKGDSIGFYNKNPDLINRFQFLITKVFGIENFKEKNQKGVLGSIVYSKLLTKYLEILDFTNKNKEHIPSYFFNLPKKEIQSFIRGYFDGDGTVSKLKIKGMVYPTPVLYNVKREFLSQLQSLMLLKLEISCKLKKHNTSKGLMHKLVVRGNEGRVKFLDIGAISKHKSDALKEIKKVDRVKEHENTPHPSLLINSIKENLPYKKYRNKDWYVYKTGNATKHSVEVLYDLAHRNNLLTPTIKKEFDLLQRDDIAWEKVENIEDNGKQELFDFTVDKDSFSAAPYFLMHNSKFYGESEKKIRDLFEEAEKNAPTIIFIDELDAIAPKREDVQGEVERRVVSQLLTMMDGLNSRGRVVVIGATNRINSMDPALRRPGRFDRELEISVPDKKSRLNILKIHTRSMPLKKDVNLDLLAGKTHGFVGADLSSLAKEAAMNLLRKLLPEFKLEEDEEIPKEVLDKILIGKEDFEEALKVVRPSAMREVLVETPNIGWDNVGGLDKIKQELIEAVEWPLKYSPSFERLGIRPPKGILLYGPPGTGKTLLAKAVAKESEANFIQVKGPSLLSMWVGKSLPYNEELIVRDDRKIKRIKIGDIVEKKLDVEVLAFDKEKKIRFAKINDHIKHELNDALVEITTRTGRKIKVTKDHSLFSFINGKLTDISANYLIPNESYIAIPKNLNLPKDRRKNINLYNYFKEDKDIFVSNIKNYLERAKRILGLDKVATILNISKKYLADISSKNLPVSISNFDKLIKESKLALDFNEIKIKLKGSPHNYPVIFDIDKDFWRLVGLWIAEGDFNSYTIRIHNQNPEIRKDLEKICNKYNFSFSKMETCTTLNSLFLQKIFTNVLQLPSGAESKRLPPIIYALDKESKANMLKGYFSGDGSIYAAERGKFKIEATTVSKNLANDLLYLLLDFGIVATCYEKPLIDKLAYRISILGVKNFGKFKEIEFIDTVRNSRISKYIDSRKWNRSDIIPLSGGLYELASKQMSVYSTNNSIGKEKLKSMLVTVDKDKTKHKDYWDLVDGDIFFDLVKEIKVIPSEKQVYDIEVSDGQNFIGGFGGVIAHNSEEAIRKIFEKARQVSPCIIFFDEMDSLAGKRGIDHGSKVTERVLNQLLAEMDGIEDLKNVMVIGATNRPDMLDSALLRPGRFDRVLLVDTPDEKSRKKILEIHTKNMPLDKSIKLNSLVKKTEGFVGADIENLVREAAMLALRNDIHTKTVTMKYFEEALAKIKPSVSEETAKRYKKIEDYYLKKAKAGGLELGPIYTG
jgi:SpoVK/Ycf46/Vps4 family AAA+-type ATPase/intein/homing endonuclease